MKRIFTLVFLSLSFTALQAQFTLSSTYEHVDLDGTNEVKAEITITNTATESVEFTWVRENEILPVDWKTNVCDPQICYLPLKNTANFTLAANASGLVSVHLKPTADVGYAKVNLKIYPTANAAQSQTLVVEFGQPEATDEFQVAPIEIYPNPATSFFTINHAEKVANVEIFNILGVKMQIPVSDKQYIDISSLKPGLYFVRLSDAYGDIILTQRLQKN